jgi:hypothetical protein
MQYSATATNLPAMELTWTPIVYSNKMERNGLKSVLDSSEVKELKEPYPAIEKRNRRVRKQLTTDWKLVTE